MHPHTAVARKDGRLISIPPPESGITGPHGPLGAGFIHLGAAKEIYTVLAELGANPERIIAEAGLDPRLFDDGNNLISFRALGHLLALCIERTNCPHFGLLVGQKATLSSLGLVGLLMRHAETVGHALQALQRHLRVQNRGAVIRLDVDCDLAILSYLPYEPSAGSAAQHSEGALATTVNALRALCGSEWTPSELLLARTAPADLEPYRRFFRAPIRFDQETAALVLSAHWLKHRVPGADPAVRCKAEKRVLELEAATPSSLADDLRRLLRVESMRARCTADEAACLLSIHRRTLTRRLKTEGTCFKALADEIRFEIARQLLIDTQMTLVQVAAVLDFSEPAAFTRAFRSWSGLTPSGWRAEHKAQSPKSPLAAA
jgi:AraC-like DNA-binding protein